MDWVSSHTDLGKIVWWLYVCRPQVLPGLCNSLAKRQAKLTDAQRTRGRSIPPCCAQGFLYPSESPAVQQLSLPQPPSTDFSLACTAPSFRLPWRGISRTGGAFLVLSLLYDRIVRNPDPLKMLIMDTGVSGLPPAPQTPDRSQQDTKESLRREFQATNWPVPRRRQHEVGFSKALVGLENPSQYTKEDSRASRCKEVWDFSLGSQYKPHKIFSSFTWSFSIHVNLKVQNKLSSSFHQSFPNG